MDSCWKYPACYGQEMRLLPLPMSRCKTKEVPHVPKLLQSEHKACWTADLNHCLCFCLLSRRYASFKRIHSTWAKGVFTLYIAGKAWIYSFCPSAKINPAIIVRWISCQIELEVQEGGWILHENFATFVPLKPSVYHMDYMYPKI